MQKNYRDYTVGELLDMGLKIDVYNHTNPSKEKAYNLLSKFEGIKRTSYKLESQVSVVKGWKNEFEIINFIDEEG
ncbi:galactokinase [Virgibacillus natechei]|uniref:Galactokinase n=2 Tax=Virgibacillus natechei TaxID=1216297 RepID=A0ABS4IMV2_9BACI|nr:hypothetical protein [Virgibacillus natechei]MBP1971631.1 galactokinase [Virgibacillus natechei]UZD13042.1 hypothetical protein OLD84_00235 [Virgibacillus natechei]